MWVEAVSALAPVLFAAVIVFGVVGGVLLDTILRKLLPALRAAAEERNRLPPKELEELRLAVSTLNARLAEMESADQRLIRLEESVGFLHRLLESRATGAEKGSRPDRAPPPHPGR